MNKKTMMLALTALAVLGLAIAGVSFSEDSDAALAPPAAAAGTNEVTMNTNVGETTATKVITAYGPLDDAGIFNQGIWYVAKGGSGQAYAAADSGSLSGQEAVFNFTKVDGSDLGLSFKVTRNAGQYTTEITATGVPLTHDVYAAFCIASYATQLPEYKNLTSTATVVEQWVQFKITVSQATAADAKAIVFDKSPDGFTVSGTKLEMKTGEYTQFDVKTAVADSPSLADAVWYAKGLPAGLTMSSNGTIFGYLSQQVTPEVPVYVSAVVGTTLYTGTINLSSSAPAGATDITLEITSITGPGKPTLVDMGSATGVVNRYVTVGSGELTVNLSVTGSDTMNGESFSYRVLAKDGSAETVQASCTGNVLTLNYGGSGEFIVLASYAGSEQVLMQLVSVAPVQDVVADIQFNVTNDSKTS